jgi:hypothetical protein
VYQYKQWKYPTGALTVERAKEPTLAVLVCGALLYASAILTNVGTGLPFAVLFVLASAVVQVVLLLAAAYLTAVLRGTGFGALRHAAVKFAAIYLVSAGVGAWAGGWVGGGTNLVLFAGLTVWLFDVDWVDATLLCLFDTMLFVALLGAIAAYLLPS